MEIGTLYSRHVEELERRLAAALSQPGPDGRRFDGVVFHAGRPRTYHADDQVVAFRATPHFRRWTPLEGPDHWLVIRPGSRPRAVRVVPRDFWEEPPRPLAPDHPFADVFDVEEAPDREAALRALGDVRGLAYVGPDPELAGALGLDHADVEPAWLMARLDWDRACKTAYEVHCLRGAARRAAQGHAAARRAAGAGCSERAVHAAYLEATGHLETETPYPNIVAWNEHASVLHYGSKSPEPPATRRVFLIDAGAAELGYASDVTRTYAFDAAPDALRAALDAMDDLQRELVECVAPDTPYLDVHRRAVRGVAAILRDLGLLRVAPEEACERGLVHPFMPHGVGHQLGVQVHDVGGTQAGPCGGVRPPPERDSALRNTRVLEEGHVVTVEPGLYFIPVLLEAYREGGKPGGDAFDWNAIDRLIPCGGIRIEDDVLVTASGREDLTRGLVPGHRAP